MSGRVSVIVANRNGERLLPPLLDSLVAQTRAAHEVIVVDDASRDLSREVVRARGGAVRLLELPRNVGASEARNRGTEVAGGDVLAFVDNDAVAHPDWLREGVACLERHPDWGAAGSLVTYHANPEILNGCGADLNRSLFGLDHGFGRPARSRRFAEETCLYAMANGLFVRREAARAVGAWDPAITYYYEDVDFCLRLWLAGFAVGVAPRAVLRHKLTIPTKAEPLKTYVGERHRIRVALKYLTAAEGLRWLRHELGGGGGGPRVIPLASYAGLWMYNLVRLPGVLAFRARHRGAAGHAEWRRRLDPGFGPREVPLHNFRPAPEGDPPRDRIECLTAGGGWRHGAYPPEAFGGSVGQGLDGDSAIDVELTARCRRVAACVHLPERSRGVVAHLHLDDARGAEAWRGSIDGTRGGWSDVGWPADVPAGRYRLLVEGAAARVEGRRLLLAYSSITFLPA